MYSNGPGRSLSFVDLFAGLGGFHLGLSSLGHHCVFASELDEELRALYQLNFGLRPSGDIRDAVANGELPEHDIMCAGFPCQPFSKAGTQLGFSDPYSGDLFSVVVRIAKEKQPRFVLLENVPNFLYQRQGETWRAAKASLQAAGYTIDHRIYSPHHFGVPQIRERLFIVGAREDIGLGHFFWPEPDPMTVPDLGSVLGDDESLYRPISSRVVECLDAWQAFLDAIPPTSKLPSFPIWSAEFGATYPYCHTTPHALGARRLWSYAGTHGRSLADLTPASRLSGIPSYALTKQDRFPQWKVDFIRQNREFYDEHRSVIDAWLPKILSMPPSWQKLEWNCQGEERDIWKYVIQFRASGVRVKRPTTAPSLVAMTSTQVPIIAWARRYMTIRECARLQSMGDLKNLPTALTRAFGSLGNAVNVELVRQVTKALTAESESLANSWPECGDQVSPRRELAPAYAAAAS